MDSYNNQDNNPLPNDNPYQNGNSYQNNQFYTPTNVTPANSFALAAMIMGILAIIFGCVFPVYLPQIFAALTIIFALLSKGSSPVMHNYAKAGITTAIIGFVISIVVIISSFYLVFNDPEYRAQANAICEELYGQSLDDLIGDSLGNSMP